MCGSGICKIQRLKTHLDGTAAGEQDRAGGREHQDHAGAGSGALEAEEGEEAKWEGEGPVVEDPEL